MSLPLKSGQQLWYKNIRAGEPAGMGFLEHDTDNSFSGSVEGVGSYFLNSQLSGTATVTHQPVGLYRGN